MKLLLQIFFSAKFTWRKKPQNTLVKKKYKGQANTVPLLSNLLIIQKGKTVDKCQYHCIRHEDIKPSAGKFWCSQG